MVYLMPMEIICLKKEMLIKSGKLSIYNHTDEQK